MRNAILAVLLLAVLAVVGCSVPSYHPIVPEKPVFDNGAVQSPLGGTDGTWISPGRVEVGNYYPGAKAEYYISIHNGKESDAVFDVAFRYPDNVRDGFNKPPVEAQGWVKVSHPTLTLKAGEIRVILVTLAMPKEAEIISKKWEFWVSAIERGQGMVQTELCSQWLVNMR